jgi:hypothetical protein
VAIELFAQELFAHCMPGSTRQEFAKGFDLGLDLVARHADESTLFAGDSNFRQWPDLELVKVVRRR